MAIDDTDTVNDTTGIGGDDYYPMGDDADPADDIKPGAKALMEVYDHLMDQAEIIQRLSSKQENPKVQKLLDAMGATFEDHCQDVLSSFAKLYPDLPAPGPVPGTDADAELDPEPDAIPDEVPDEMGKDADGMDTTSAGDGGALVDDGGDEDADPEYVTKRAKRQRFVKRLQQSRDWRAFARSKRLSKSHSSSITKAADYLDEISEHEGDWKATHKSAASYHGKSLRAMCKDMAAETGNPSEPGTAPGGVVTKSHGRPAPLTPDERAELEAFRAKLPAIEKQLAAVARQKRITAAGR